MDVLKSGREGPRYGSRLSLSPAKPQKEDAAQNNLTASESLEEQSPRQRWNALEFP